MSNIINILQDVPIDTLPKVLGRRLHCKMYNIYKVKDVSKLPEFILFNNNHGYGIHMGEGVIHVYKYKLRSNGKYEIFYGIYDNISTSAKPPFLLIFILLLYLVLFAGNLHF